MRAVLQRVAILLACLLGNESALADYVTNYASVDVSRWQCLLCEFERYRWSSARLSVATVTTTDDSDRFGRHGSFETAGTRSVLNARLGMNRARGWLVNASATNLGLDSNDVAIEVKGSRSVEAKLRFQQYHRVAESEALTPFRESDRRLTLGSNWQRAAETNGFSSLEASNRLLELATTRRLLESTVSFDLVPKVKLLLDHSSSSKEGIKETFRDGFLQSTALPKTVDQESATDRIQISYRDQNLNATTSRSISTFKNNVPLLRWESPYRFGLLENESANAFAHEHISDALDIKWTLTSNTVLRIHESRGQTKTTPQSLKYGISPSIDDIDPVFLFAERKYKSRRHSLISQLTSNVGVSVSRLQYQLKDHRPIEELTPALGGLFLTSPQAIRPGDIRRLQSEIGLNYRPDSGMRFLSRVWENSQTRSHQEIAQNRTHGLEAKFAQPVAERLELLTTFRRETRAASEFKAQTTNNPYTRRFHQAALKRQVWSGGMRYFIHSKNDFVSLTVDRTKLDYPNSVLGLAIRQIQGLTLASRFQIGPRLVGNGHVASHRQSAEINGSQSLDLSMPWLYATNDRVNSVGLNLTIEPINRLVDNILVDYTLSDGQATIETTFDRTVSFFPNQISRQESIDVSVRFMRLFETLIAARIYIEKYDGRDWSIDDMSQTTLPNVLSLRRDNPSYRNTLFSIELSRSF